MKRVVLPCTSLVFFFACASHPKHEMARVYTEIYKQSDQEFSFQNKDRLPAAKKKENLKDLKTERKLYFGKTSSEAKLEFTHFVVFQTGQDMQNPPLEVINKVINNQVKYLFASFSEMNQRKAVPKENAEFKVLGIQKLASATFKVQYKYTGVIVIQDSSSTSYNFILPTQPQKIWQQSMGADGINRCTDQDHYYPQYYWYFWNIRQSGCVLKKGEHYEEVVGRLTTIKNTEKTFPEYNELVRPDGTIHISILMGLNDPSLKFDPRTSSDVNAPNYMSIRQTLLNQGFQSMIWSNSDIKKIAPNISSQQSPFVEEFVKSYNRPVVRRDGTTRTLNKVVVRMFFGDSEIDNLESGFHHFVKDAMEKGSVLLYAGHSGLGSNLNLEDIEANNQFTIQANKDQYQIYFFNSCSSYPYYNELFFNRKIRNGDPKGTQNLDIITNGLATFFSVIDTSSLYLIRAIINYADNKGAMSYQDLANAMDSSSIVGSTNLLGINGDEDNPTAPMK